MKKCKSLVVVILFSLSLVLSGCGDGEGVSLGCKVTCSDVDNIAACEQKCEDLLKSKETLDTALTIETE